MDELERLLEDGHPEDGATKTLHAIQAGGQNLVITARRRVGSLLTHLEAGEFRDALEATQAIASVLAPLAQAQRNIAIAENAKMLYARELKTGMVLTTVGEVTDVEVTECSAARCDGHVKIKIGEHEVEYGGSVELYVDVASLDDG